MMRENELYFKIVKKVEPSFATKVLNSNVLKTSRETAAKELSILTLAFRRPLIFLRSFGNNPFSFFKVKLLNSDVVYTRFDFKYVSWLTLYSVFCQIFYLTAFSLLAYRLFSGDYRATWTPGFQIKPRHGIQISEGLLKAFLITFFLACAGGCLMSFRTSSQLAKFLNNWADFVFKFPQVFPGRNANFSKVETTSKRLFVGTLALSSLYLVWAPVIYQNCLFYLKPCTRLETEQSYVFVMFGCTSIINMTYEHYKLTVTMTSVAQAFAQVKIGVSGSKQMLSDSKDVSALKNVFSLVYILRKQTKLLIQVVGSSQMFAVFFLFSLFIIIWMMIMQLAGGDFPISLLLIVISIGILQFGRFGAFGYLTERIEKEEKMVLDEVLQIKTRTLKAQIELQFFVDLVISKPSQFKIGNVITVKRSLLLSLMTNSTTYLIAIMQLADVQNVLHAELPTSPLTPNFLNYTQVFKS